MSRLHVGCAIEGAYVPHSAAMLHSVLAHSGGRPVTVHYLHGPQLPRHPRGPLTEMVERHGGTIEFVTVPDEELAGLPVAGFTLKATWYRALVADLLPALERILFLDADLLALDDLGPLWDTELGGRHLAAVTNVFQADHLHRPAELGIDRPQRYFNAGVMLLDLDALRRDECARAMRDFGVAHADDLMFRDQDALNVVLGESRLELHPRWNFMNSFVHFPWAAYAFGAEALDEARRRPGIRHFEGPDRNKPWHWLCQDPARELYFEHRRHTPWPEVEIEGRTLGTLRHKAAAALRHRLRP
jgi:lipopolysaccharide biosynthesis glycosyltransferase